MTGSERKRASRPPEKDAGCCYLVREALTRAQTEAHQDTRHHLQEWTPQQGPQLCLQGPLGHQEQRPRVNAQRGFPNQKKWESHTHFYHLEKKCLFIVLVSEDNEQSELGF